MKQDFEKRPLLSVVMGCYNSEDTICEAITSILEQTFSDFEFIIIDDCSRDRTIEKIESFNDQRIRLIRNEKNQGLGYSLNLGVRESLGKYIARMDADDISLLKRFQCQVKYLESHPDVMCVGTGAKKIGNISLKTRILSPNIIPPVEHEDIKARLLIGTPILHPSVMLNGDLLRKHSLNYSPEFSKAQDYELWSRMVWEGQMSNLKEVLLCYRYSKQQASCIASAEQVKNSVAMYNRMYFRLLGRKLTKEEELFNQMFATKAKLSVDEFEKVKNWLDYLYPYILASNEFDKLYILRFFSLRFAVICRSSFRFPIRCVKFFGNKKYGKLCFYNIKNAMHLF